MKSRLPEAAYGQETKVLALSIAHRHDILQVYSRYGLTRAPPTPLRHESRRTPGFIESGGPSRCACSPWENAAKPKDRVFWQESQRREYDRWWILRGHRVRHVEFGRFRGQELTVWPLGSSSGTEHACCLSIGISWSARACATNSADSSSSAV